MYNKLFFAIVAVAALASCAKNEVNPVLTADKEISYQTVVGPKTKADVAFKKENVFVSYAYRLDGADKTWAVHKDQAVPYINGAVIGYTDGTPGVWRSTGSMDSDRYYWPDNGSLTFFAWSNNKKKGGTHATDLAAGSVNCSVDHGITVTGYNAADNINNDFMVARMQADLNANGTAYGYTGVPTVFEHKMCQVKYSIRTNVPYTVTKFRINNLIFKKIYQTADYKQFDTEGWTHSAVQSDYGYNSAIYETNLTENKYPADDHWDTATEQYYFIPQAFTGDDQVLRIEYSIKTGGEDFKKYYVERPLREIFPEGWAMNKKYTVDIVLGLNEVLWAPGIEDWETGTAIEGGWTLIDAGTEM